MILVVRSWYPVLHSQLMTKSFVSVVIDQASDDVNLGRIESRTQDVVRIAGQVNDVGLRLVERSRGERLKPKNLKLFLMASKAKLEAAIYNFGKTIKRCLYRDEAETSCSKIRVPRWDPKVKKSQLALYNLVYSQFNIIGLGSLGTFWDQYYW